MYRYTQQQLMQSSSSFTVPDVPPAYAADVDAHWVSDPLRYYAPPPPPPPPPHYLGSLYASTSVVGVHHYWHNHFYRLHTGDVVCRNGPCLTCSSPLYNLRLNYRQPYIQPYADPRSQALNYAPSMPETAPAPIPAPNSALVPAPAPQVSPEKAVPVVQHPGTNNTSNAVRQNRELPNIASTGMPVKQEPPSEGETTLLDRSSIPIMTAKTGQSQLGTNRTCVAALKSQPMRTIKDDKMLRIQAWRSQVQTTLAPDHPDAKTTGESEPRSPPVKRKADGAIHAGTTAKRIKLETEDTVVIPNILETKALPSVSAPRKNSACEHCRAARKKCDGKRATCAFASPKTRAKARWKNQRGSAKDGT